ncbi:MAG: MerR family transcriptional regulator [Pseudomonadota bacterium]
MQLTVGELATRSGLTVRTLHHFDQIGLLRPLARSAAGYRLYGRDDVARLHGIQALRQLGLPLQQIASVLDGDGAALPLVVARQIHALDAQIAQASALRSQLGLLMDRFSAGTQPALGDWLQALAEMAAYARHFSADEIRRLLGNWQAVQAEWPPLLAQVRAAMAAGLPATDSQVQPLAQQWMGLIHHWLGGDFTLIERWGRMVLGEPQARRPGGPDLVMVRYIEQATTLRLAAWQRHFSLADLGRFRHVGADDWRQLADDGQALINSATPLDAAPWQALAARLQGLLQQLSGHDPLRLQALQRALAAEPLLRAGLPLPAALLAQLQALAAVSPSAPARSAAARPRRAARSATPSGRTSPG